MNSTFDFDLTALTNFVKENKESLMTASKVSGGLLTWILAQHFGGFFHDFFNPFFGLGNVFTLVGVVTAGVYTKRFLNAEERLVLVKKLEEVIQGILGKDKLPFPEESLPQADSSEFTVPVAEPHSLLEV